MTTPTTSTVPENPGGTTHYPLPPACPWPPTYGSSPSFAQPLYGQPYYPVPPIVPLPLIPPNSALIHLPSAMQVLDERYKAAASSLKGDLGALFHAGWRVFALVFLGFGLVGSAALIGVTWWGTGALPPPGACLLYALTAAVLIALPTATAAALAVSLFRYVGLSVGLLKELMGTMKDILLKP